MPVVTKFDAIELAMSILSDPKVNAIFDAIPVETRIVGGTVRDVLRGETPKDVDFATVAKPDEVIAFLTSKNIQVIETGLKHGTVTAVIDHTPFEITTLRTDHNHDGRHADVSYITDFELDAARRDFTVNAMSMDRKGNVFDYFDGNVHLKNKILCFVGNPRKRIEEDALRIMRFFRFLTQLDFSYGEDDFNACAEMSGSLENISKERIWMEVKKIASLPNAPRGFAFMKQAHPLLVHIGATFKDDPKTMVMATSNPITRMTSIGVNVVDLAERWKMANEESKLANFLGPFYFSRKPISVMDYQKMIALNNVSVNHAFNLSVLLERKLDPELFNAMHDAADARFPVDGFDMKDCGMKTGVQMGETLRRLKEIWVLSKFRATKEQLLSFV